MAISWRHVLSTVTAKLIYNTAAEVIAMEKADFENKTPHKIKRRERMVLDNGSTHICLDVDERTDRQHGTFFFRLIEHNCVQPKFKRSNQQRISREIS
jgi:hypothetical protein